MNNLNKTLKVNDTYTVLDNSSIASIKLNGNDVKSSVTDLSVSYTSITKDGSSDSVSIDNFTSTAGTYKIIYTVSFKHEETSITKKFTQTVTVN